MAHTNLTRYQLAILDLGTHGYKFLTGPIEGYRPAFRALLDLSKKVPNSSVIFKGFFTAGNLVYRMVKVQGEPQPLNEWL